MDVDPTNRWLIGLIVSVFVSLGMTIIGSFRNLAGKISAGNRDIYDRIDDVKERYVRRDDLDGHVSRIETNIKDLRDEQRDQHKEVMTAIATAAQDVK